jgi:hypothetical protein
MGFIVVAVVIVFGGLIFAGWAGFALFLSAEHLRKKAEANAPAILDETFSGAEDVVVKVNLESLPYERYVLGAKERGYRLANETSTTENSKTLIFERAR